jgi:hypothetical protein
MVVVNPNLEYGPCGDHTFANPISPFTPFAKLTRLLQDRLVKLCDDQSLFSHTTFKIPHIILYIGQ